MKVLADGFEFDGRAFGSLSAAAKAATGSHCNGFAFFGLDKKETDSMRKPNDSVPARPATLPLVRCAVYTRKSTEEGLQQEFNSLDAQREAAEAYVASQRHDGWACLPDRYDDGGYTGGNTDRPAFQRLLADVEAGRVDCVVVYKVDRLSRSLMDFARVMALFDARRVSFVSVTQQFNTATAMGRLVLNVLLSFAQFEREIVAERTRDKMAAMRRRGKWAGGLPPLGYDVEAGTSRLKINPDEADRVRAIFELVPGGRVAAAGGRGVGPPRVDDEGDGDQGRYDARRAAVRPDEPAPAVDQRDVPGPHRLQGRRARRRTPGRSSRRRRSTGCRRCSSGTAWRAAHTPAASRGPCSRGCCGASRAGRP